MDDTNLLEACFSDLYPVVERSGQYEASSIDSLCEVGAKVFARIPGLHPVIDALDECNPQDWNTLLERLTSITQLNETLKVVITSRLDIVGAFEKMPVDAYLRLGFSKKHVNDDLKRYVKDRLRKSKTIVDKNLQEEVEAKLLSHADVSYYTFS